MKDQDFKKIVIAGEGGQGVQTIAKILLEAGYRKKFEVSYIPNFGVEQRGGVSVSFLIIGQTKPIVFPKFDKGDIVVLLSERSVKRSLRYIDKKTTVIYNSTFIKNAKSIREAAKKTIGIDATTIAKKQFSPRVFNIIILGSIIGLLKEITLKQIQSAVKSVLSYKFKQKRKLEQLNLQAVEFGYDLVTKD